MPPRVKLPHGLTKSPFDMSRGELGIAGLLATSIGIGLYQLATSPWGEEESRTNKSEQHDRIGRSYGQSSMQTMGDFPSAKAPMVLEVTEDLNAKRAAPCVDDGITQVGETVSSPKVTDGVTEIQFGEPRS